VRVRLIASFRDLSLKGRNGIRRRREASIGWVRLEMTLPRSDAEQGDRIPARRGRDGAFSAYATFVWSDTGFGDRGRYEREAGRPGDYVALIHWQ
jgi:hypothetical protein